MADPGTVVDLDALEGAADWLRRDDRPLYAAIAYSAVSELVSLRRQVAAVLALHGERPNTRCRAYHHSSSTVPGPPAPPLWCVLTEGHDGEHVASDRRGAFEPNGWHDHLPGTCERCNVPAPCPTVRALEEPSE